MEFTIEASGKGTLVFNDRDASYYELDIRNLDGDSIVLVLISKDDIKRLARAS